MTAEKMRLIRSSFGGAARTIVIATVLMNSSLLAAESWTCRLRCIRPVGNYLASGSSYVEARDAAQAHLNSGECREALGPPVCERIERAEEGDDFATAATPLSGRVINQACVRPPFRVCEYWCHANAGMSSRARDDGTCELDGDLVGILCSCLES